MISYNKNRFVFFLSHDYAMQKQDLAISQISLSYSCHMIMLCQSKIHLYQKPVCLVLVT